MAMVFTTTISGLLASEKVRDFGAIQSLLQTVKTLHLVMTKRPTPLIFPPMHSTMAIQELTRAVLRLLELPKMDISFMVLGIKTEPSLIVIHAIFAMEHSLLEVTMVMFQLQLSPTQSAAGALQLLNYSHHLAQPMAVEKQHISLCSPKLQPQLL